MNVYRRIFLWIGVWMSSWNAVQAQDFEVLAGPIYGHYTDSSRHFWMAVAPHQEQLPYAEWISSLNADLYAYFTAYEGAEVQRVTRSNLVLNRYVLVQGTVDYKPSRNDNNLTFLLGSCAFPYPFMFWRAGDRELIFDKMTAHDKDFMIWMGDNVYYLNGEWRTRQRMHQKNLRMRFNTRLDKFLKSCPGVFCHFSQQDADFFLLDARFHARDSSMLGASQTQWLFQQLKASTANFKFIVSGTQILPDNPMGEDMGDFGDDREGLLRFLSEENITGVIFLSGDRHYGELMRLDREGDYPLYEMTSSPLTSLVNPGYTRNNPLRQPETLAIVANFGKVELLGTGKKRFCRLALFDKQGQLLWQEDVLLKDLQ